MACESASAPLALIIIGLRDNQNCLSRVALLALVCPPLTNFGTVAIFAHRPFLFHHSTRLSTWGMTLWKTVINRVYPIVHADLEGKNLA